MKWVFLVVFILAGGVGGIIMGNAENIFQEIFAAVVLAGALVSISTFHILQKIDQCFGSR